MTWTTLACIACAWTCIALLFVAWVAISRSHDAHLQLTFAWRNLWIGLYYDRNHSRLFFQPLPTLGLVLSFKKAQIIPFPDEGSTKGSPHAP